jgi:hypothetical protein
MDHRSKDSFYTSQLEQLGFYVGEHPAPGILDAVSLRASRRTRSDARLIDRSFKYDSVLDPDKLGVTDIYELDGTPCIYFKSLAADPTPEQVKAWHHAAWNHGLARMLWVCTPRHIRVFNAYAPPPEDVAGIESPEILLFTAVADRLGDLKTQLLDRERIDSGEFWAGQLGQRVNRETRIDERLVKDLTLATARLTERNLKPIEAHRLLLRTIFVAYLEAKGVLPPELFDGLGGTTFERVLGDPQTTETFFHRMHDVFNGDLFPPPPQQESLGKRWTPQQLEIAQCVLARTDLTCFQRSFNFWRYDFSVIPIELISSIYEKFIHAADPDKAKKTGTHYTPTNLVDFVLSQVFDDELFESRLPVDAKVVDLASGSGVFLVEAFRRLVARRLAAGEKHTRDLVRDTLYNQIYGIDIEETAIEIAAFSLCLTAFELDPVPNSRHQLRFKQQLKGRNLFADNAFDPLATFLQAEPFRQREFHVIIGNPPWTRPKGRRSKSYRGDSLHVEYCRKRKPQPAPLPFRDPPEQAFIWRSQDFAQAGARIGVILEGKRFFSYEEESLAAKRALLSSFQPRLIVNLAALHDQKLFPATKQPALVLIAENSPARKGAVFPFAAVEFSRTFRNHGILQIGPENVRRLSVSLAAANPIALKVATWGTARDLELVDRLTREYPPLDRLLADKNLAMHQGFIEGLERNRTRKVPRELHGLPCLSGGRMTPFDVSPDGLPRFSEDYLQWPRHPDIYRGPLLLCTSGLRGNRIAAGICESDLVYSLSQYGVPISRSQLPLAAYLVGILNSSLATYLVFLTASKWGLGKYEILNSDYLRIPLPVPSELENPKAKRVVEIVEDFRTLAHSAELERSRIDTLDKAVFALYGLDAAERVLVEDMLEFTIDFQRKHERSQAVRPATTKDCGSYARQLVGVIQPFLETQKRRALLADVIDVDAPLRVVQFRFADRAENDRPAVITRKSPNLDDLLKRIAENLDQSISIGLHTRRHLRIYADDTFYVIKPSQRRFWSRAAGLTDGDSVLQELMAGRASD